MTEFKLGVAKPEQETTASLNLSPLEHALLLGSTTEFSGKEYSFVHFSNEAKNGKIDSGAFIPESIKPPLTSEEAQALQERREKQHFLVGMFPFLDEQVDELPQGYQVYVQPVGLIDEKTGAADPVWRISIVDGEFNPVKSEALGNLINLAPTHNQYLSLTDDIPGSKLMHLSV